MLHINDLTYRIEGRTLFDQATLALSAGQKMGLVGRNGSGKSTLFNLICGDLTPESGSVSIQRNARLVRVQQEVPGGATSVIETVLSFDTERKQLLEEARTATDPNRIGDIQARLGDIDAHSAEARGAEILAGLGFDQTAIERATGEYSGGWRMRIALAGAIFAEPDLLLLDEPTNYLDLEGAIWLEMRLKKLRSTVLLISHDRDLLNGGVDHIAHLRERKLFAYRGGYDTFEETLAEQARQQLIQRDKQEDERRRLQAFVDRFRAKATKAKQAQSRVKRLEKMQEIALIHDERVSDFHFPDPERRMAPPIIQLDGAAIGYGETPILKQVTLRLDPDDRIGLLGRNGAGKSTFAKLLAGRLDVMDGRMKRHKKLQVAFFTQHQLDDLPAQMSAYQHVAGLMPDATEAQKRSKVASFGFDAGRADTPASDLSGGERARLLMHLITFDPPHLLILDEPTNHLDMESRRALAVAINDYDGAVIMISHDRHLIETCVDRLWLVDAGTVKVYDEDMDAYRRLILSGPQRPPQKAVLGEKAIKADRRREAAQLRGSLVPLEKDVEKAQAEIDRLSGIIALIDKALLTDNIFERKPDEAIELSKKRARAEDLLNKAEETWLERAETLEAARRAVSERLSD
jgi:ATP-binding cassette, subfamily F, member 3